MLENGFKKKFYYGVIDSFSMLLGGIAISMFFLDKAYSLNGFSMLFIGFLLVLIVLANNTIVPHYDRYLKDRILNSPIIDAMAINALLPFSNRTVIGFRSFRFVVCYLTPVIVPAHYRRNKALAAIFGDFDFVSKVTIFERVLAFIVAIVCFAYFVLAIVYIYQLIVS